MSNRIDCARTIGLLVSTVLFTAAPARAAELTVSNGGEACPGATYSTIQSAVDAAAPHDTVTVCPGTYTEQVLVSAGKDGVTLRARERFAAVIAAPAVMSDPGDIVRIQGARDVTLEGFTIAGPLPDALFCSPFARTGVRVDGGGSATIRANRFTDIRSADPSLRGCQNGIALLVGSASDGEVGAARIEENEIDAYQKVGIEVDNVGSSAVVVDNQVTGDGPSTVIGQNGIQISNGADAVVANNHVTGLLFYKSGRVSVVGNHVSAADYGIAMIDVTEPEITGNTALACTADGIDLDEEDTGTTGALVVDNESRDNGQDGLFVSVSSKKNALRHNSSFGNGALDAEDDSVGHRTAGTANVWEQNHCKTDNHGGLLCER